MTLSDLTPAQRKELLRMLRSINAKLDRINGNLDILLRARGIKRKARS